MRFTCPSCNTPYNVPDERLPSDVVRTRCQACGAKLFINAAKGSVQKNPPVGPRVKTSPPSPKKFRGDTPTVLSMSKGVKKEKDPAVWLFLILILSLGIGSLYYAFTRFEPRLIATWLKPLSQLKEDLSIPRILHQFTGKKEAPTVKKEDVSSRHLVRRGYDLYLKERLDPALEAFDQAVAADPKNPKAHYWKGRTLLKMGKEASALEAFDQALALRPDYWEALDNVGWLHLRRGEYPQSLSYLNRSIELKPDNAWAFYNRGFLHAKLGNSDMALKDAETACRLGYQKGCRMAEKFGASKGAELPGVETGR